MGSPDRELEIEEEEAEEAALPYGPDDEGE